MRPEKKSIIEEIRGRLDGAGFVLLTDCRGMTSEQFRELRGQLRGVQATLKVIPNALFGFVAKESGLDDLSQFLAGPTAMIVGSGDVTLVAKSIKAFTKTAGNRPVIKGGSLTGRTLTAAEVESLAEIPPREVLLGMMVGTIAAPMTRLVGVMNQKLASLLYVLNAVADKKVAGN